MWSYLKPGIVIAVSFTVLLTAGYNSGYIIGAMAASPEDPANAAWVRVGRAFGILVLLGLGVMVIFRTNRKNFKDQKGIFARFGGLLLSGIIAGGMFSIWQESGPSIWYLLGLVPVVFFAWVAFKPAKEGETSELQDLLMGDMTDPVQRKIMIRTVIAILPHMWLASLVLDSDMALVDLSDGVTRPELLTIAAIVGFFVTLAWLLYETKLFFEIDEYFKQVYTGPMIAGLVIYIGLLILNDITVKYFGADGWEPFWKYMSVWMVTALFMMVTAIKATSEET